MVKRILLGVVAVLLAAGLDWKLPYAQGFNSSGSTVAIYSRTTSLTAAQILALDATGLALVAAAGANKVILPISIVAQYVYGAHPYNVNGGNMGVHWAGVTSPVALSFMADPSSSDILAGTTASAFSYNGGIANAFTLQFATTPITALANLALNLITGSSYAGGPIASAILNAGGSGYLATDTFTISGDSGDATGIIDTVNGSGAVLTYHLTANGTGYTVRNAASTTGGTGAGLKLNITGVTQGDGTLKLTVNYSIADVS